LGCNGGILLQEEDPILTELEGYKEEGGDLKHDEDHVENQQVHASVVLLSERLGQEGLTPVGQLTNYHAADDQQVGNALGGLVRRVGE